MYIYQRSRSSPFLHDSVLDGLGQATWSDSPMQQTFRDNVLRSHIARSTKRKGSPVPDLPAAKIAPVPGTKVSMRTDAALSAGALLAAANVDLSLAKAAGDRDALKTVRISATSGYRDSGYQAGLWKKYFPNYYNRTGNVREKLAGGGHGGDAVGYMVKYVGARIAAPGFSNHQAGVAIDFWQERTKGNTIENSSDPAWVSAWHKTWFFAWLNKNAARFGFYPYIKEPWHWEYRPSTSNSSGPSKPSLTAPTPSSTTTDSIFSAFLQRFRDAVRSGQENIALQLALGRGIRNENELTSMIFNARHPERQGRRLAPGESGFKELSMEWINIRNRIVRPSLQLMRGTSSQASSNIGPSPVTNIPRDSAPGPFGTLTATLPDGSRFTYDFTSDDALWAARFMKGEASSKKGREAVLWAMFNRFAFFTHKIKAYKSFGEFIRSYSTTLQPYLKNPDAVYRSILYSQKNPRTHKFVQSGVFIYKGKGKYHGKPIPKGQLQQHLQLQQTPWEKLPEEARLLVEQAFKGKIPNPGIGLASEFANTRTYYWQRHGKYPNTEQWQQYTEEHARNGCHKEHKGCTWVGQIPDLDQFHENAFFIDNRVKHLPVNSVQVLAPR